MSKPKFSYHDSVMIVFGILFVGLFLFTAGAEAQRHNYQEAVVDVLLGAFFLAIFGAVIAQKFSEFNSAVEAAVRDARYQEKLKAEKATGEMLAGLNKFMDAQIEEKHQHDMVEAIIKDIVGKGKPAAKHCAKIEKAIHDNLELFADVSYNKQGGFDIGLSKEPIEKPAPGRSAAHEAARKRGDASRAKANKKPVTTKKGK